MPNPAKANKSINATEPGPLPKTSQRQSASGNGNSHTALHGRSVPELVSLQARATPGALAVAAGGQALTYGELEAQANQLAHHLRGLGVGREVRVGLCLDRSVSMVVGALGILKAGGAYIPLDPAYPPERLAFMLTDAQAPVIVTRRELAERLPAGKWQVVSLDGDAPEIVRQSSEPLPEGVAAGDLAYVIYTSGSTGQPKGVEITHGSLLNLVTWHQKTFEVTPEDRATQQASPGFDAAVWELWPYLTAGASVHFPDEATRMAPELLRDWLLAQRITISFVPTPMTERLLGLEWPSKAPLRMLLTGGDALHHYPSVALPFLVVNNYGPTECTVVATSGIVPPGAGPEAPTIGRPIANTDVYILDENLQQVAPGTPGELCIGGLGLARGYLNRPDLSAEKFVMNPFNGASGGRLYRTGDRARYLPDGQIAFMGRMDELIKIRGFRIEPNEIITVLNRHAGVEASVVVAREDAAGDKRLVAYIVPAPKSQVSETELRDFLGKYLPEYMLPTAFVRLESLPLTPNGKVDRAALPAPNGASGGRDAAFVAPRSPVEERLSEILAKLMSLEQVGVNDNFFLLGGHSLLGTQVIARVRDVFRVELPLRTLFDSPTIADLSREIEQLIFAKLQGAADGV
jgi:amino acid adenylation domain-containing protein